MFSQNSFKLLLRKPRLAKATLGLVFAAQFVFMIASCGTIVFGATNSAPDSPAAIIYDNGPLATGAVAKVGTNINTLPGAPAGAQFSELQNEFGNTTESNSSSGSTANQATFRLTDNFVVPVGETWTINTVLTFGYLTGGGATTPFTAGTLQIWNGRPGDAGSTIIFGDTTTNRLASSTDTNLFRIFNSAVPNNANVPGLTRRIWQNNLTVSPALVLTAGNYWIDWATTVNSNPATAHFSPTTTIVNTRGTPLFNARQSNAGTWVDIADAGAPASAPDVPQDFPFKLDGTKTTTRIAPPVSRTVDFDGDNKSDYAVARAANATSQTTWYVLSNSGTQTAFQWGTGVGFAGGDVAVPADYDGDGKTDVAVWRAAAPSSVFYILQSQTNTVRYVGLGLAGDDPTVTGDYDGDGKADPTVYRNNSAAGGQNFFYYLPSAGAANNLTTIPFGLSGDKPYPGDFDGDGKFDPAVYRNNSGNAQHFQLRSTQGYVVAFYGLFTDRFVTADFDGDYKNDLVAVRTAGANYAWYVATSTTNQFINPVYGSSTTDYITPGDYDGDNRTDFAIFRSGASGVGFYQIGTLSAPLATNFGSSSGNLTAPDYPVASYQVH